MHQVCLSLKSPKTFQFFHHFNLTSVQRRQVSVPLIYWLRLTDKDKKLKNKWLLNQTDSIKLYPDDATKFDIQIEGEDKKLEFRAETADKLQGFLKSIWRLSQELLREGDRPNFINFKKPVSSIQSQMANSHQLSMSVANEKADSTLNTDFEDDDSVASLQFEISKKDEESLLSLMSDCNYASLDVDKFVAKITEDLTNLETVIYKN